MLANLQVIPRLPAINLEETQSYFENALGFTLISRYPEYLIMKSGSTELHFFEFKELDPLNNYSMIYIRVAEGIEQLYQDLERSGAMMHPNGKLEVKLWGVKEFAILDPNHTLLTFGQLI
ncbi:MAG: VOC family protein [Algoriphagus sp.]|jgi:catechol 2,3-dioxygenase-like lactoylglutathione lyase family enzyme|uniref:bleomycin resistance protein n=1 Tax=Algoriphagus sp. TaxID=1872435 RepID=UPI002735F878|nr:VOC family protein [Algoriphagus sp.]MDP3201289.1 VOC family protein [Algoriphagus sp.]